MSTETTVATVAKKLVARRALKRPPALEALAALREEAAEAEQAVKAAQATYDQSARWHAAAERELGHYIETTDEPDPARLAELRNKVGDLAATRMIRDQRGNTVRYADRRAHNALLDAQDTAGLAQQAVNALVAERAEDVQRELLTESERVRDRMLEAFDAASEAVGAWRRQRNTWLDLMETWGMSPTELPPLVGTVDPHQAMQDGLVHQHTNGGHIRHPRLITPAPVSVQLADPADAHTQVPGNRVPDDQRRYPRQED